MRAYKNENRGLQSRACSLKLGLRELSPDTRGVLIKHLNIYGHYTIAIAVECMRQMKEGEE